MLQNNFRLAFVTIAIFVLFVGIPTEIHSTIVSVGSGSYTTNLPSGANPPLNQNGEVVYPATTDNVSGPIPTTDWWTSLVYQNQSGNQFSETLVAHPLMMKCQNLGLGLGTTPDPAWNPNYSYSYTEDLVVGVVGLNASNSQLDEYSDWTVSAFWESGVNSLNATFGHGLPYVYFTKTG